MPRIPILVAVLAAAAAAAALPADAFRARNGVNVYSEGPDDTFVVSWSGRSGAPAFWCAAGEYTVLGLGLPTGTQIYRYSPPPRRSGEDIVFGFDPTRAQATGLARVLGGRSVSAAHARIFCEIDRMRGRDR